MPAKTKWSLCILGWGALLASSAHGQIADAPDDAVAGIPVNYTEAKAGSYKLPDALKLNNGKAVTDVKTWRAERRPEIRKLIEQNWFGRAPGRPADMTFDVLERSAPAFDGKAVRSQVTIFFTKDHAGPRMELLVYVPANATGPVPLFLNMSFSANNLTVNDPGVLRGRRWDRQSLKQVPAEPPRPSATAPTAGFRPLPVEQFIARGIGVATFNKDDLAPDFVDSEGLGVKSLYLKPGQTRPADDEWGAIAAWSWGASRALDYIETDKRIDSKRVAIHGVSRLGKTALWGGAADERFAMVIASCSGEGGAAIARRNYGETLAHMSAPTRFPYQFAPNYAKFGQKVDEWPVDANMLLAMIAPRPLLLQTGNTDKWSDPYGEFLAAVAVEPVYRLFGKRGLETTVLPKPGEAILHDIGYVMHEGGHGTVPSDFEVYIRFMEMHLKK
ncbi:MAG: putative acetyl xylan esterase [Bryobacterales bacterium]|nr:putative acetyl xylan esterase [Bryobacterales bacterium]